MLALFRLFQFSTLLTFFVLLFIYSCSIQYFEAAAVLGVEANDAWAKANFHVPSKSCYPRGLDIALHERPSKNTTGQGKKHRFSMLYMHPCRRDHWTKPFYVRAFF